ncbi:MAG: hypothetical protein RLZ70_1701 [Verrucomicrobiota bacterium]|jgi:hypothetical protein
MRNLLAFLALLGSTACAHAQWNIFAEKLPAPGSWATYQIKKVSPEPAGEPSIIKLSIRDGGMVKDKPHVWLSVEPVSWLGSSHKAPLRFLVPKDLSREGANKLLESSAEILFSEPVKGPWHMLPEDVASIAEKAGYKTTNTLEPETTAAEPLTLGTKTFQCRRLKMESYTIIDPPFVKKQTIILRGTVWRDDATPFGVVQAKWTEKTIKAEKIREDEKVITLVEFGKDETPPPPLDHGERFSLMRLLLNR